AARRQRPRRVLVAQRGLSLPRSQRRGLSAAVSAPRGVEGAPAGSPDQTVAQRPRARRAYARRGPEAITTMVLEAGGAYSSSEVITETTRTSENSSRAVHAGARRGRPPSREPIRLTATAPSGRSTRSRSAKKERRGKASKRAPGS